MRKGEQHARIKAKPPSARPSTRAHVSSSVPASFFANMPSRSTSAQISRSRGSHPKTGRPFGLQPPDRPENNDSILTYPDPPMPRTTSLASQAAPASPTDRRPHLQLSKNSKAPHLPAGTSPGAPKGRTTQDIRTVRAVKCPKRAFFCTPVPDRFSPLPSPLLYAP